MRSVVLVLLSAVCFGTTGTAVALGAPGASPLAVGAARIAVGGTLLALVAGVPMMRGARVAAPPARLLGVVAIGALGVVAYQPLFFAGTRTNGVAVGAVVALGSAPLITGLLAWLLDGVRPSRRWALATAVAVVGLGVLAASSGDAGGADPLGLAASLGAGASYSVFALVTKRLLDAGWTSTASVGAVFGVAALLSVPLVVAAGVPSGGGGLAAVLWLGVVTTALAYVLFSLGLRELTAPTVATLTLAEPLTATLLGLLLLGEHLGALQAVALLLLALGLAVLAVPAGRRGRVADRIPA
ncbi:drug/metabolite transporter, DME family [Quadrisphaera granulorum]|uniref:DME family drug/metabolite transporter n=1 Tax=Quadrisphaera granulorum TaxID=317664 RepID=A0A315ZYB0_9ACTN|nr:DMT family transporter [Quadrisphaera granulorum]PWJ49898.1 DME family drug/metabolite transporter [Quadrisphaera granulorum]SZE98106.1 drug/metabolite transporter, DME family [Quadrisphaera granulorum]